MTQIDDRRTESTWFDAPSVIRKIISALPEELLVGLRSIRLYDACVEKGKERILGRYRRVPQTRRADIELFFWRFDCLPSALKENEFYHLYIQSLTLCHELYHHWVRALGKKGNLSLREEERQAREWAYEKTMTVLSFYYKEDRIKDMTRTINDALIAEMDEVPDPVTGKNMRCSNGE